MNSAQIAEIKQANSIATIVQDFGVALKSNRADCPLCAGKKSFSIDNNKGLFHCFKCNDKGDVIEFVKKHEGLEFIPAVKMLAAKAGVSVESNITTTAGLESKAAAKYYLEQERKLLVDSSWYEQENFGYSNKHTATVRFYLDKAKAIFWERFVDSHLFDRNFNIKGKVKNLCWHPPKQQIRKGSEVFITEAIFDALSLIQIGKKAVSSLSCHFVPTDIIKKHINAKWIIAYDGDSVGIKGALKAKKIINELGAKCEVYVPPKNSDWNDLLRQNKLNNELLFECYWRGQILTASTVREKMAWNLVYALAHNKYQDNYQVIAFNNCYFSCSVDDKQLANDYDELFKAIKIEQYTAAVSILSSYIKAVRISDVTAELLYTQIDTVDESHSYYFEMAINTMQEHIKIELSAQMITDAKSFHHALLQKVGQATFYGDTKDMQLITKNWFKNRKPVVDTIRHMGYSEKHQAYVFPEFAYKNGKYIKTNKHNYINFGNKAVKTVFKGWAIPKSTVKNTNWFNDLYLAAGNNGLTGLVFWFMSLFAQQIRAQSVDKNIPFWEFTGVFGSGKSTIIEFFWKLVGRHDYEGEDPEKLSFVALARTLMQASNIPVVITESDRNEMLHRKKFSFDSIKTLFRGQSPYGRGLKNHGIETDNEPFLGTLVVSQNAKIEGEPQVVSRFVSCNASKKYFTNQSLAAANRLKACTTEECVYFLHVALSKELEIMTAYKANYNKYYQLLASKDEILETRIAETHAKLMAFGKAMQLIVPELTDEILAKWERFMVNRAIERQKDCSSDTLVVQAFWEIYDTYNDVAVNGLLEESNLNHSRDDGIIAINLNHFKQFAEEHRQQVDLIELKRLLPGSKKHKFITRKVIRSVLLEKNVNCWIFENK